MEVLSHSKRPYLGSIVFAVAVIAIVLFSGLPAAVKLVDSARYQDDLVTAEAMTLAVKASINPVTETSYDAYDVKTIVRDALGEDFSFIPRTNNAGFFYVESSKEIQVIRYREAATTVRMLSFFDNRTELLWITDVQDVVSPEEVLKEGIYYLGGSGVLLSQSIELIRTLSKSDDMQKAYELGSAVFEHASSGIMNTLYEYGSDDAEIELARSVYETFKPSGTLFVDDEGWTTAASSLETIRQIVFEEGIKNIPIFDLVGLSHVSGEKMSFTQVTIPKTVLNIESGAFGEDFFDIECLVIKSVDGLYVQYQALTGVKTVERDIYLFQLQLIDFSDFVEFTENNQGEFSLDISHYQDLFTTNEITGYQIVTGHGFALAYLYSNNILFGYATNAYVVDYFAEEQGPYPLYTQIQLEPLFVLIDAPLNLDKVFLGWKLGKYVVIDHFDVSSHKNVMYAEYD